MQEEELAVPRDGLKEIERSWISDGALIDLLSSVLDDNLEYEWQPDDIIRRSYRILLEKLEHHILSWPTTMRQWEEILPITTISKGRISNRLQGNTNWVHTSRRFGWPPRSYVIRSRDISYGGIAVSVMAWLSKEIDVICSEVKQMSPVIVDRLENQIKILKNIVEEHLTEFEIVEPDRFELHALTSSGYPWHSIAESAQTIIRAKRDPEFLAYELLEPDIELRHVLFHISVFGYLIGALRQCGFRVVWKSVFADGDSSPLIRAIHQDGTEWDLWFESRHMRSFYDLDHSAYESAVQGIEYSDKALSYDILLVSSNDRALILECKWSNRPPYVGRDGFHQVSSYALDARNGLAGEVWAFVIGPEEIVTSMSIADEMYEDTSVVLGSAPASMLVEVLAEFLSRGHFEGANS
ncbi:hypothetical protein [Candidatus Poriferisocius sp.]|uniref:hypothetical protein n=1 Tax=Candidatus Poriferisocius sp. TaxID=3101276 RepID=UPI003B028270